MHTSANSAPSAASGCFWQLLAGRVRSWGFLARPACNISWLLVAAPGCFGACGCFWLLLAVPGCSWRLLAAPGCSRLFLAARRPGGPRLVLAAPGVSWRLSAPSGCSWLHLAASRRLLAASGGSLPLLAVPGCSWRSYKLNAHNVNAISSGTQTLARARTRA